MARVARGADLIISGGAHQQRGGAYQRCDPGELMLKSGRPVLVVPDSGGALKAERIVVAWKDSREARRALADSLPFLKGAEEVRVVGVCRKDEMDDALDHVKAVVAGLKQHGVRARSMVVEAPNHMVAWELNAAAGNLGADLIVSGGYGHSRLGEWAFGGVTYELLRNPERFVLLSH